MAFNGSTFVFDGIASDYYGLYLYSFEQQSTIDSESGDNAEFIEDRLSRCISPLHYGCVNNKPLEFEMTFGSFDYLDKYDVDIIASWLTEQHGYKYLNIIQDDMQNVRYKCKIKELKNIHINGMPIAFKCKVVSDSPYAYSFPQIKELQVNGTTEITLVNDTNVNRCIYPKMKIVPNNGVTDITILNKSDNNREMKFTSLPSGIKIDINNEKQIITSNQDVNLYDHFNGQFFRLKQGVNRLSITGSCTIKFICEFLRKVGS